MSIMNRDFNPIRFIQTNGNTLKKLMLLLPVLALLAIALNAPESVPVAEAATVKGHFYFFPKAGSTQLYYSSSQFQGLSVKYRLHDATYVGDDGNGWGSWLTATWVGTYGTAITCSSTVYSPAGHWSTPFYDDATYDDVEFQVELFTTDPAAHRSDCTTLSPIRMTASAGTSVAFGMSSGTYPAINLRGLFPP